MTNSRRGGGIGCSPEFHRADRRGTEATARALSELHLPQTGQVPDPAEPVILVR